MATRSRLVLFGGVGALVFFALIGLAFVVFRNGGSETASPNATTAPTTPSTATIQPPPTPETPSPTPITELTHISVPPGGTVEPGWGLVLGNALTGGAEVWLMPGGTMPQGISPSGRYFVAGDSLFDGWTGKNVRIQEGDRYVLLASFAPDDSRVLLLDAANQSRILKLDGTEVARLPQAHPLARASASQSDVVWSLDSRAVAITRREGDHNRVDVVFDDRVQPELASNGMAGWSNKGHKLAVTGNNPAVYDFDNGTSFPLAIGGGFPSWSDGDEFVAVDISTPEFRGVSVMDMLGHLGTELVRVYNLPTCLDIYWRGRFLQAGAQEVLIPAGDIVPRTEKPRALKFPSMAGGLNATWYTPDGTVYATASITDLHAISYGWVRRDVDQTPPAVFLGLGGKDLCLFPQPNLVVVHPPFTADQIPKPTPTPDK